jgi:UDP-N-acetylmuramoylalanine--D-glutamate ligase
MNRLRPDELLKQRILVLGYGVNHRALVEYLLEQGCELTIRDANPIKEAEFQALHPESNGAVTWEVVPRILDNLQEFTVIFRSPSIPYFSKELERARKKGILVTSQTNLFLSRCPAEVIGITGTKGKGTTATLTHELLKAGYHKGRTYIGGNIGVDPFTFLGELTEKDLVVLELSSFQLEDAAFSPHIAVILHVTSDHLDHHTTIKTYREAKAQILHHQKAHDVLIIPGDYPHMEEYARQAKGKVFRFYKHQAAKQAAWVDTQDGHEVVFYQVGDTLDSFELPSRKIPGEHNLENILPAVLVGALYNVPGTLMATCIAEFPGLAHRLSVVENNAGITVYDDSIATNPESAAAALAAMPSTTPVHLIAGGRDKGQVYSALGEHIAARCATLTLLPGKATPQLERAVKTALKRNRTYSCVILHAVGDTPQACMEDALKKVASHLHEGDIVLLSPAAASDAPFPEYKERGNAFVTAVQQLKKEEA